MSSLAAIKAPPTVHVHPVAPAVCAVTLFDREVVVPASAHTLSGFRAWALSKEFPERGRISFIDGEIFIDLSPEDLETHNQIRVEIGHVLPALNKKSKLGTFYANRALLSNEQANVSTEPDALFVTWESRESARVRLTPSESAEGQYVELVGSPDWVLEVVSDSSVRKDTHRLREGYFRAGIGEYWLIDARGDQINFQILVRGTTGFEPVTERKGWLASPLFQRRFRLVRERDRMDFWEYTLEVKSVR